MKKALHFLYGAIPLKKFIYIALKKVWAPPEMLYKHLHFQGVFTVKVDDRSQFAIYHHGYQIENEIFWNGLTGGWEKTSMGIWITLCRKSKVIFDVGANTGVYSLVAKAVHPGSLVYAFEPVTRVYAKLLRNNKLNGYDIVCNELAVSDQDGQALIYDTAEEHILSVTVNKNLHHPKTNVIPVDVKTIKLASLMKQNEIRKIDLIKVDVETHEPEVLEGLEPYLTRDRPALLIEVLNDEIGKQIEKIVQGKNYLYFNIDENNGVRRTNSISKSDHYNYLLCQEQTARDLGLVS